jgi:hypothetical protein
MNAALQLDFVAAREPAEAEPGIRQAPGLHQVGFGDAQFEERGLQSLVVQQRDLHRVIRGQRLGQ